MEKFINVVLYLLFLVIVFFMVLVFAKDATAADYSAEKELFLKNESGGVIAVTKELCTDPVAKAKGFEFRAYATEGNGTKHEGCWSAPDLSEAPSHPSVRIIPIINMYFEGQIIAVQQQSFKPFALLGNTL